MTGWTIETLHKNFEIDLEDTLEVEDKIVVTLDGEALTYYQSINIKVLFSKLPRKGETIKYEILELILSYKKTSQI